MSFCGESRSFPYCRRPLHGGSLLGRAQVNDARCLWAQGGWLVSVPGSLEIWSAFYFFLSFLKRHFPLSSRPKREEKRITINRRKNIVLAREAPCFTARFIMQTDAQRATVSLFCVALCRALRSRKVISLRQSFVTASARLPLD